MSEPVRYRLAVEHPARHIVELRAEFPALPGGRYDLRLPVWSPGSYLVREYARHVSGMTARDGRGRRLSPIKVDKATWRVEGARGGLRVDYQVYGFERSVRTNHVTAEHAFVSGPATFLYTDPHRGRRIELKVEAPRGWDTACALPFARGRFTAQDYDELVDSPIDCGRHRHLDFVARGTPFRMAICGRGNESVAKLRRDLKKVAEAEHDLFGHFPFASYLTLLNLTPASRGGLEHRASAALEWPRLRFGEGEKHEDFLALWAHELFHAWNVKAAAPRAFRPYHYQKETPTRLLWWFEGITDYYDELLLRRAGLLTPRRYLDRLVERWERLLETPGRNRMSVADASFDAWIKFYRPDESTANTAVSYYEKGHLVGALLDLDIRRSTGGQKSLDDVLRRVVERGTEGLPEDGVRKAVEAVTRSDWGRWFADYVEGTRELPLERAWRALGLALEPKDMAKKHTGGWLGAVLKGASGRVTLQSVSAGGPAEAAGLSAHDEIVALDGYKVEESSLRERLDETAPGERARVTYFRDDALRETEVKLGTRPAKRKLVAAEKASKPAQALTEGWLAAAWAEIAKA